MTNPSIDNIVFRPMERKILDVLSDGCYHIRTELMDCLTNGDECRSTLNRHIFNIRQKLEPIGQTVVCCTRGAKKQVAYRHVKHLHHPV